MILFIALSIYLQAFNEKFQIFQVSEKLKRLRHLKTKKSYQKVLELLGKNDQREPFSAIQ